MRKITFLSLLFIATSSSAASYAEFNLRCIEKKVSDSDCLSAYRYAANEKANLAYSQKDYATAFKLYMENAKKGNFDAERKVAFMFLFGYGTPQSNEQAERWYIAAAEKNDKEAQYELADFYLYGTAQRGEKKLNYQEALKWALKAANQGQAEAQSMVGDIYKEGYGAVKNYKEANKWFTLAANQGHYSGFWALAVAYEDGYGVKVDYVKSYMMWNLAVATIPTYMTNTGLRYGPQIGRDALEKKLKPSQIEQAQHLAKECVAKNYKNCV